MVLILSTTSILKAEECELTEQYKKLVADVKESLVGSKSEYFKCYESIRVANYWKSFANCVKQRKGDGIAGGCYHVVGNSTARDEISDKHCEALKPLDMDSAMYFNIKNRQRKNNVQKCKDNNESQQDN